MMSQKTLAWLVSLASISMCRSWMISPTRGSHQSSLKEDTSSRRDALIQIIGGSLIATLPVSAVPIAANAAASSTQEAEITDRIFIDFKGLPTTNTNTDDLSPSEAALQQQKPQRIVIGLFGKDSPQPVSLLKKLVSKSGLPAPCRPKAIRTLQREQLEANKVYNSCIETEDKGVVLDYSTIWRIIKDERVDVGAVSGKFISREYPTFDGSNSLRHDAPGVVSVRRGNDGGFGFTIYPGPGNVKTDLDDEHIVIGRVVEGMDIVNTLNQVPVAKSSKINYKALTGETTKNAPSRSCRYGGDTYCNENKPLQKISITQAGLM